MNISIQEHHVKLGDSQKEYIEKHISSVLKHLGRMALNEAAEVIITITQEETKAVEDRFLCEASLIIPKQNTIHASTRAITPEAGIDILVEKLDKQAEKLKGKFDH